VAQLSSSSRAELGAAVEPALRADASDRVPAGAQQSGRGKQHKGKAFLRRSMRVTAGKDRCTQAMLKKTKTEILEVFRHHHPHGTSPGDAVVAGCATVTGALICLGLQRYLAGFMVVADQAGRFTARDGLAVPGQF
jgi:hypothetical protein